MDIKELMEYLAEFDDEVPVEFLIMSLEERIHYKVRDYSLMEEMNDYPVICLEVESGTALDPSLFEE